MYRIQKNSVQGMPMLVHTVEFTQTSPFSQVLRLWVIFAYSVIKFADLPF